MYGMIKSEILFDDDFIEWFIEAGFKKYQCQISIYYKYATYGTHIHVLCYVDDFFIGILMKLF